MAGATHRGRVIGRSALSPRVTEVTLRIEGEESFRWIAGQHMRLRPEVLGSEASPYSIAAAPTQAGLRELTLAVANDSDLFVHAQLGSALVIEGPFGRFVWHDAPGALLVGAGTGVAPLRAIAHDALASARWGGGPNDRADPQKTLVLVAGNRSLGDLLWHRELLALAKEHARFAYEPVVSQPDAAWVGRRGYVQAHLSDITARLPAEFRAYLCGGTAMVDDCRRILAELGVPPERILSEADS